MATLFLTLNKPAFDVMVTGEKSTEYRKASKWIESRLYDKDGKKKHYDAVHCVNGYGHDKPFFIATYRGFDKEIKGFNHDKPYSNGLVVGEIAPGDYKIYLGHIVRKGNLKQ
ncbi:hypothetical protein [Tenacibaculum mesophilum]|uniref:hypothetical protein n=1 Tax=Tenacibaculum mesophilum TaxID=104268 RepID=UPI00064AF8F4|nr:hypothetical protein [Tenacibaculum mesophilum]